MKFAKLETLLGDVDRARAVYELAVEQPLLDMPEVLWKAYIDFEVGQEEWDNARNLYERLLISFSLHVFYEDCRKVTYILVKAALLRGY